MGSISGVRPTATAMAKKKALFPIVLGEAVDEEDQGNHDGHEADHEPGEAVEALGRNWWARGASGDGAGHAAEVGVDAGGDDDGGGGAAFDAGAHEADVVELSGRRCGRGLGVVEFFDGERFAGEAALADEEVLGREARARRRGSCRRRRA